MRREKQSEKSRQSRKSRKPEKSRKLQPLLSSRVPTDRDEGSACSGGTLPACGARSLTPEDRGFGMTCLRQRRQQVAGLSQQVNKSQVNKSEERPVGDRSLVRIVILSPDVSGRRICVLRRKAPDMRGQVPHSDTSGFGMTATRSGKEARGDTWAPPYRREPRKHAPL